MFRSRKITMRYRKAPTHSLAADDTVQCPFCHPGDREIHVDTPTMQVVENKFPYEFWDNRSVIEHLLLIPKRHVFTLDELTTEEKAEAIHLMSEYESKGYSIYWRSQNNKTRTVPHQHTHLFKLSNRNTRFLMYIRRPYFLWKF